MEPLAIRKFTQGSGKRILFCGDDDIDMAAIYLAAIIHEESYDLDYIPSPLPLPPNLVFNSYDLIILSDYPREQIKDERLDDMAAYVREGGSLLMIGGWESFTGLNIEYKNSPLEAILPVKLLDKDDRRNYDQGIAVISQLPGHAVCRGLDWSRPGIIGGYNAFEPKEDAECVLCGRKIRITVSDEGIKTAADENNIPLLVTGKAGKGRVTALAFDLAPHWVGGFVDWGTGRKHVDFADGFIEVGDMYYRFVANLLKSML